MKIVYCPFCKEEIKADAIVCRHCHERLSYSREEVIMSAISVSAKLAVESHFKKPTVTACGALCLANFSHDKLRLNECLDDCKVRSVEAMVTARVAGDLLSELCMTFKDIIWGGGDIDPLPLEEEVRRRFSHPDKP